MKLPKKHFVAHLMYAFSIVSLVFLSVTDVFGQRKFGEAIFVYQNNGKINAFLRSDIDSITHSCIDLDSLLHDEFVVQEVYTRDSVYRIPLEAIDSVSWYTPPTVYQPEVINISDDLMPYVLNCDSMTITLAKNTPVSIIPQIGDKLVTLELNDLFPSGFMGEVIASEKTNDTHVLQCKRTSLASIFKSYCSVSSVYGFQGSDEARMFRAPGDLEDATDPADSIRGGRDFNLATYTISRSHEISRVLTPNDNLALSGGTELSVSITPQFHITTLLMVNERDGTYFNACVIGDFTIQEKASLYGGISYSRDFAEVTLPRIRIAPLINFFITPGLFFDASATASFSAVLSQRFTTATAFDFSTRGTSVIKPTCGGRLASAGMDVEGCVSGRVALGGFLEFGLEIIDDDISKLSYRGELGVELVGNAVLTNSDVHSAENGTAMYERLKNSSVELNGFLHSSVQANVGRWGVRHSLPFDHSLNIRSWDLVPSFSNVSLKQCLSPQTSADAYMEISGNCLFPVSIGMSVRNSSGQEVAERYAATTYTNRRSRFAYTFTDLASPINDYTLYPKVTLLGIEMLASPSSKMKETKFPVEIVSFNLTKSYNSGPYEYRENKYDISHDCTIHVKLTDSNDVVDWGYEADFGIVTERVSLISMGNGWRDYRSFYRNEHVSKAHIRAYVKLKGKENYYYGEKKEYDLSLPVDYKLSTNGYPRNYCTELSVFGSLDQESQKYKEYINSYGFDYSIDKEKWIRVEGGTLNEDTYSIYIHNYLVDLLPNTTYYISAYVESGGKYSYGDTISVKTDEMVFTLNVNPYATSAVIKQRGNPDNITKEFTLLYSLSDNPAIDGIEVKREYSSGNYFYINNLIPATTYYYCCYTVLNGIRVYTDIESFRTEKIEIETEADVDNSGVYAIGFHAKCKIKNVESKDEIRGGFTYNENTDPLQNGEDKGNNVYESKNDFLLGFWLYIWDLKPMTTYYYRAFIEYQGKKYFGNVQQVTTPPMIEFGSLSFAGLFCGDYALISTNIPDRIYLGHSGNIVLNTKGIPGYSEVGILIDDIHVRTRSFHPMLGFANKVSVDYWRIETSYVGPGTHTCCLYAKLTDGQYYYGPMTTIVIPTNPKVVY